MSKKNRRRRIWIDRDLQSRIVRSSMAPMVACLVGVTVLDIYYQRAVAAGVIPSDGTIFGIPEDRAGMLALALAAVCLQLAASLRVSQRVAGTTRNIQRVLRTFRRGDRSSRIRLRTGDYQILLGAELNDFLEWVEAGAPEEEAPSMSIVPATERAAAPVTAPAGCDAPGTPEPASGASPARESANLTGRP